MAFRQSNLRQIVDVNYGIQLQRVEKKGKGQLFVRLGFGLG
jgi:hypothetical protein